MVKYDLEEFKAWLAADPERKKNLSGSAWNEVFRTIESKGSIEEFLNSVYYQRTHPLIKQWKQEIDHQRERERAITKWGGRG